MFVLMFAWQDVTEVPAVSRQRPGSNLCPLAAANGVSVLHGNCGAFSRATGDPALQAVFQVKPFLSSKLTVI